MALPKKLKNFNLFIDGGSYLGQASEVNLPKLTRQMEEYRGGGMNMPVDIDMGMEKMEAEFTMANFADAELLKTFGICDVAGVALRFAGALQTDDSVCKTDAVEMVMRGRFSAIEPDAAKSGDDSNVKYSSTLAYFKYSLNGEVLVEIDAVNFTETVGGVDRMAEQRAALGI